MSQFSKIKTKMKTHKNTLIKDKNCKTHRNHTHTQLRAMHMINIYNEEETKS